MGRKRFDYVFEDLFMISKVFNHLYYEVLTDKRITKKKVEEINNYIENKIKPMISKCQEKIKERVNE